MWLFVWLLNTYTSPRVCAPYPLQNPFVVHCACIRQDEGDAVVERFLFVDLLQLSGQPHESCMQDKTESYNMPTEEPSR